MKSCPWRIYNDHISLAMQSKKIVITNFNYIAGKKSSALQLIQRGIFFCVVDRIFNYVYTNYFFCFAAQKNSNASGATIQIINGFRSFERSKIFYNIV